MEMTVRIDVTEIGVCLTGDEESAPKLPPSAVDLESVKTAAVGGNGYSCVIVIRCPSGIAAWIMGVDGIVLPLYPIVVDLDIGVGGEFFHSCVAKGEHIIDTAFVTESNRRINRRIVHNESFLGVDTGGGAESAHSSNCKCRFFHDNLLLGHISRRLCRLV